MGESIKIRREQSGDESQIFRVVADAFPSDVEARLVDLIRAREEILLSLVATTGAQIIGHVLVSPIKLDQAQLSAGGLAPLSVRGANQTQGVGGLLMKSAISESRKLGLSALFLLGDPGYYSRFGFTRSHFANEYGATHSFMHLELEPGVLTGLTDTARYVSAFTETGT